jgi:hypothetical protein
MRRRGPNADGNGHQREIFALFTGFGMIVIGLSRRRFYGRPALRSLDDESLGHRLAARVVLVNQRKQRLLGAQDSIRT